MMKVRGVTCFVLCCIDFDSVGWSTKLMCQLSLGARQVLAAQGFLNVTSASRLTRLSDISWGVGSKESTSKRKHCEDV